MLPSGHILKAGRALAGLTSTQLAKLAKIDASTISRMESSGPKPVHALADSLERVVRALEAKGVLITENGVELAKKRPR